MGKGRRFFFHSPQICQTRASLVSAALTEMLHVSHIYCRKNVAKLNSCSQPTLKLCWLNSSLPSTCLCFSSQIVLWQSRDKPNHRQYKPWVLANSSFEETTKPVCANSTLHRLIQISGKLSITPISTGAGRLKTGEKTWSHKLNTMLPVG